MIKKKIILKNLTVVLFAITISFSLHVSAQTHDAVVKSITVKGTVQFVNPNRKNTVILYKETMDFKQKAVDSVEIDENHKSFIFHLKQDHQGIYEISACGMDRATFWSDANVSVAMRGFDTAKYHMDIPHFNFVEGSFDNNYINLTDQISDLDYLRMVDEYNEKYYADQHKKIDSAWATYLSSTKRYDSLSTDLHKRMDVITKIYKDRPVLFYTLRTMTGPRNAAGYDKALGMLDKLIKKYPWLTEAKGAKETIIYNRQQLSKLAFGQPLPSVSYPDADGKLSGLEKYKGKYLLIDFWASWCGPCRAAIPKVKELYNQYHDKGFDVVSISIDTDKGAWKKAMQQENMPWQQLLSSDKDKTMKEFQFSGIPTLYLIDPAGNIMQKFTGYSPEAEASIKSALANKEMAPTLNGGKAIRAASF